MAQVLEVAGDNLDRDIGLIRQQAVQVAESAAQITVTLTKWLKARKYSYAYSKERSRSPTR